MASVLRFSLQLTTLLALSSVGSWTIAADCCCSHCGCKQTKKMTRLVTSLEAIETPVYQCTSAKSFHPTKGIVSHTKYRCDKFYKLHTKWCCQEHCVCHEHCEDVTHYVDMNPCDSECACHTEHHHKKYFDYQISCRCRGCMSCQVERGCKTHYGASPKGCHKQVCTKQPTGEVSTRVVPVVRWVTFHVCRQCDRRWPTGKTESRQKPEARKKLEASS